MIVLKEKNGETTFEVIVQPRSSRSQVVGELDGALKVKLSAPPIVGRANDECVRFLATLLDVRRSDIEIVSGTTARRKRIRIYGLSGEQLGQRLDRLLAETPRVK